jgi:hypothetical protein
LFEKVEKDFCKELFTEPMWMIFGNSHWHCSIVVKPQRMAVVIGRRRAVAVQSCEPAAHFLRFVEGFLDDAIEWQTLPRESTWAIGDWRLAIGDWRLNGNLC